MAALQLLILAVFPAGAGALCSASVACTGFLCGDQCSSRLTQDACCELPVGTVVSRTCATETCVWNEDTFGSISDGDSNMGLGYDDDFYDSHGVVAAKVIILPLLTLTPLICCCVGWCLVVFCCISHYQAVEPPEIGVDVISAHNVGEHTYKGDSMPLIEVKIPPQHTMIGESAALCYFEQGIKMDSKFDDGSQVEDPNCAYKCRTSFARKWAGENMSMLHFTNEDPQQSRTLAIGCDTPGHIVSIDLDEHDNMLFTMNGSFVFGAKGTRIDVVRADLKQCCFGAGMCFQKLDGDGVVYIQGGGTVVKQDLEDETHRIDPSSLLAFTQGLEVSVQKAGTCMTMCCGGEGVSLTTISGTGSYWLASSPWSEQVSYALKYLPPKN